MLALNQNQCGIPKRERLRQNRASDRIEHGRGWDSGINDAVAVIDFPPGQAHLNGLSRKSEVAAATRYALSRWRALVGYIDMRLLKYRSLF